MGRAGDQVESFLIIVLVSTTAVVVLSSSRGRWRCLPHDLPPIYSSLCVADGDRFTETAINTTNRPPPPASQTNTGAPALARFNEIKKWELHYVTQTDLLLLLSSGSYVHSWVVVNLHDNLLFVKSNLKPRRTVLNSQGSVNCRHRGCF